MGTVPEQDVERVRASFGRALNGGELMEVFYKKFLASGPEIAAKFTKTDMVKQKELLRQGINLAIMFAKGNALGKSAMDRLRKSHSQKGLDINPKLYSHWKSALLASVKSLDPDFESSTESSWNAVLDFAIKYIQDGYFEAA